MDANKLKRNIGKVGLRLYSLRFRNASVLQAWIVSKIYEKTKLKSGCVQVVQELRAMLIGQRRDGFQFNDNFLEANIICFVSLLQYPTTIAEGE